MAQKAFYTLIGDVVESRHSADRARLQKQLRRTLGTMNAVLEPRVPLEPTLGDEFQGCFSSAADAVGASLLVRLELLRTAGIDSRFGIGFGSVQVFGKRRPLSQDGPGWWSARDAIEYCRESAMTSGTRYLRTYFRVGEPGSHGSWEEESRINAFLHCRDAMVDRMKQPTRNRLCGLMIGRSQAEIAESEGTTQGAISQSLARSNAFAILVAQRTLEGRVG